MAKPTSSHPTWVRGLKSRRKEERHTPSVAPHVGAWIEIARLSFPPRPRGSSHPTWVRGLKSIVVVFPPCRASVAPHVGAWIEITSSLKSMTGYGVAPHVGAWIEIRKEIARLTSIVTSHPTWVRGLKCLRSCRAYPADIRRTPRGCVD